MVARFVCTKMPKSPKFEKRIDQTAFCEGLILKGLTPSEAYKEAGYNPEGRDQSTALAKKYMDRQEVQDQLKTLRNGKMYKIQNLAMNAMEEFLEKDFAFLSPEKKATALPAILDKVGLAAPKNVNIQTTETKQDVLTAEQLAEQFLEVLSKDPNAEQRLIEATATSTIRSNDGRAEASIADAVIIDADE